MFRKGDKVLIEATVCLDSRDGETVYVKFDGYREASLSRAEIRNHTPVLRPGDEVITDPSAKPFIVFAVDGDYAFIGRAADPKRFSEHVDRLTRIDCIARDAAQAAEQRP